MRTRVFAMAVLAMARVGRGCVVFSGDVTSLHSSDDPDVLDAEESCCS
jgi:hypothetical protein